MEDREILNVIQAHAAEERRLREQLNAGLVDTSEAADRLEQLSEELQDLWMQLRSRRASHLADSYNESISRDLAS